MFGGGDAGSQCIRLSVEAIVNPPLGGFFYSVSSILYTTYYLGRFYLGRFVLKFSYGLLTEPHLCTALALSLLTATELGFKHTHPAPTGPARPEAILASFLLGNPLFFPHCVLYNTEVSNILET